jgi:hypothetical protein
MNRDASCHIAWTIVAPSSFAVAVVGATFDDELDTNPPIRTADPSRNPERPISGSVDAQRAA